jgi:hypothetical protein
MWSEQGLIGYAENPDKLNFPDRYKIWPSDLLLISRRNLQNRWIYVL